MNTVANDPPIVSLPADQIRCGDRVQFDMISGSFFFLRKNPEDNSTWIKDKSLNIEENDYPYKEDVHSFVSKLSSYFGYGLKKIADAKYNRFTPMFEFI